MSRTYLLFLGILTLFFASTLFLLKGDFFVSPDENAALVFAERWARTGSFRLPEMLNFDFAGLLHPRSALGWGVAIVPSSFLGFLVLTGSVGALLNASTMYFVTPLLAVLAIVAWRQIVLRVFGDEVLANLAAFFLLIHPAFWYYSGRVMMHNVAFVAFLIFALWFAVKEKRQLFLAGLCLGLAIFIRTSELTWILPLVAMLLVTYQSTLDKKWTQGLAFAMGLGLVLSVMLFQNDATYGNPFTFGYTAQFEYPPAVATQFEPASLTPPPTEPAEPATATPSAPTTSSSVLLPFGFHEMNIWRNVSNYLVLLYPWMTVAMIAGAILLLVNKEDRTRRTWQVAIAMSVVASIVLVLVYGSWWTVDNPDPKIISLGNSHVRYWLPIFIAGSLFAAYAFRWLIAQRRWFAYALLVMMAVLSAHLVFFGHDGFVASRQALETFEQKRAAVLGATEQRSVIVVDRADKYLFPYRRVITPLRSEVTYLALPYLEQEVPLYYFGITFPESDLTYLNEVKLAEADLVFELVLTIDDESLYRITRQP